jgi:hypothetical protein
MLIHPIVNIAAKILEITNAVYYFRLCSWRAGRARKKKEAEAANKRKQKN